MPQLILRILASIAIPVVSAALGLFLGAIVGSGWLHNYERGGVIGFWCGVVIGSLMVAVLWWRRWWAKSFN